MKCGSRDIYTCWGSFLLARDRKLSDTVQVTSKKVTIIIRLGHRSKYQCLQNPAPSWVRAHSHYSARMTVPIQDHQAHSGAPPLSDLVIQHATSFTRD